MTPQKQLDAPTSSDKLAVATSLGDLRIALANDWLVHVRGQERVFEVLCQTFPKADIYTLVYDRNRMPPFYRGRTIRTSFIQHLPYARRRFRAYLPFYPLGAASLDLRDYDVVIASSSAFMHGVSVGPRTALICYCHSPFRYIWSHYGTLTADRAGPLASALVPFRLAFQRWDLNAAERVDSFVAPSRLIQHRIKTFYGRESTLISPGVDLDVFRPTASGSRDYFLVVSPLMRWKRVDIAVQAFRNLDLPLKVVGGGEESSTLRSMATKNVEFLGELTYDKLLHLAALYAGCRATIIPSEEDFGLASLEAMACGRPVIAFQGGGALETVVRGRTGCFFAEQTVDALASAVMSEQYDRLDPIDIRHHAEQFGTHHFAQEMLSEVARSLSRTG